MKWLSNLNWKFVFFKEGLTFIKSIVDQEDEEKIQAHKIFSGPIEVHETFDLRIIRIENSR